MGGFAGTLYNDGYPHNSSSEEIVRISSIGSSGFFWQNQIAFIPTAFAGPMSWVKLSPTIVARLGCVANVSSIREKNA